MSVCKCYYRIGWFNTGARVDITVSYQDRISIVEFRWSYPFIYGIWGGNIKYISRCIATLSTSSLKAKRVLVFESSFRCWILNTITTAHCHSSISWLLVTWQCQRALQRHDNECDDISNHQPHDCLLNHLFRCRSKKIAIWGWQTPQLPRTERP